MNEFDRPLAGPVDANVPSSGCVFGDRRPRTRSVHHGRRRQTSSQRKRSGRLAAGEGPEQVVVFGSERGGRCNDVGGIVERLPALMKFPLRERRRPQPQAGSSQPLHQMTTATGFGAEQDRMRSSFDVDVVVVSLEPDSSTAQVRGKVVQLLQARVRHEMTPVRFSPGPASVVDKNRHRPTVPRSSRRDHPTLRVQLAH